MPRPLASARKPVQDTPRAFEFPKAFLFFSKFPRMRHHGAARPASRMLHVEHLVKQNIFHRARRNLRAIHPAIQQNLMGSGIIAAKLPPPAPRAPSNMRALQLALKVFYIELIEKPVQIEMVAARAGRGQANTPA